MPEVAGEALGASSFYHQRGDWLAALFLLMPDHVHALVVPAPGKTIARLWGDWKRYVTGRCGVQWLKNFFEHLRRDTSVEARFAPDSATKATHGRT